MATESLMQIEELAMQAEHVVYVHHAPKDISEPYTEDYFALLEMIDLGKADMLHKRSVEIMNRRISELKTFGESS